MEWIIVAIVVWFLLQNHGQVNANGAASTTPIIRNSTGGSLSTALGNNQKPPAYFQSGNPGYNGPPLASDQPPTIIAGSPAPPNLGPIRQNSGPILTKPPIFSPGATNPVPLSGAIVSAPIATITKVSRLGPENASPVWSQKPIAILSSLVNQ